MTGRIHSIQTLGTADGPGVRCVVFMQGCPMRCAYCHNPDTWEENGGLEVSASEVFDKIRRIKPYFRKNGKDGKNGGATLSGGEPLFQPDFAAELLRLCKGDNIHTALDTSGCVFDDKTKELIQLADLILLDIKFATPQLYQKYSKINFDTVSAFLDYAGKIAKPIWIRQVVLPGINDSESDILKLCALTGRYKCVEKLELLPFRKLCLEKYEVLGISFSLGGLPEADTQKVKTLQSVADKYNADT